MIVTNSGGSDYVFKPDYRLAPLSEVDRFIRKHRHLPGIPTEAEVKAEGVSVGEMQAKLLAKMALIRLPFSKSRPLSESIAVAEARGTTAIPDEGSGRRGGV